MLGIFYSILILTMQNYVHTNVDNKSILKYNVSTYSCKNSEPNTAFILRAICTCIAERTSEIKTPRLKK